MTPAKAGESPELLERRAAYWGIQGDTDKERACREAAQVERDRRNDEQRRNRYDR